MEDGYGSDLMGDEADRQTLAAMTQMQREKILYERGEARKAMRERLEAKRKFKEAQVRLHFLLCHSVH